MVEKLHVLMNGQEIGDLQGVGKKLRLLYNRAAVEDRFDCVERSHWEIFARTIRFDPEWMISEFINMAQRLPDALAQVRSQPDLSPYADATSNALQDNVSAWCLTSANKVGHAQGLRRAS